MNIAILISIILVLVNQFIISNNLYKITNTVTDNQKKIAETLDKVNKEVHR
jgi:hypothetical protein